MPSKTVVKKLNLPKENVRMGLAIVGPYGNIWHDGLFDSPEDAIAYLNRFWRDTRWDPKKWKLVQAEQTIVPISGTDEIPLSEFMQETTDADK